MPPQFASRARGHRAHVVLGSRPKQRPSLLGLSARSALTRDARAGCASRARGQRPLPVCPTPASWEARPDRAQSSGVLRRGLGRVRGPVWAKNRLGRALTCVSFPPSQRRAPFRGFHKGDTPLCVLFILLFAQAKNKPSARTGPGILCRLRHTSQKGKVLRSCTKRTPARGGFPGKLAGSARSGTV